MSYLKFYAEYGKCKDTSLFVGWIPPYGGVHSQGETLDELKKNLIEVLQMEFPHLKDLEVELEMGLPKKMSILETLALKANQKFLNGETEPLLPLE